MSDSWDHTDCSLPGYSVHRILQERILEWLIFPFSRGFSQVWDPPRSPSLQIDSLPSEPTGKPFSSVQFSSVTQSCPTHCNSMNCSTPGLPVHHQLLEFAQTHVHWIGDAIQLSHPLSSPSPLAVNLSQHQGLFRWVSSLHHVANVLEFQLQHQSFQWIFRTDFLYWKLTGLIWV